jgi:hypothetical protein
MQKSRWPVAILVFFASLAAIGWCLFLQVKVSVGYAVRAEFTQLPADDKALESWLAAQPGVVKVTTNRDPGAIRVYWVMVQDVWKNPPVPDLRQVFEEFGYRELTDYDPHWTDS